MVTLKRGQPHLKKKEWEKIANALQTPLIVYKEPRNGKEEKLFPAREAIFPEPLVIVRSEVETAILYGRKEGFTLTQGECTPTLLIFI